MPFLLAIPLFLIPRLYLGQDYEPWTRISSVEQPEPNFLKFAFKILPSIFSKLSWLWFMPALFLLSVIHYPYMVWTKRRFVSLVPFDISERTDVKLVIAQLVIMISMVLLALFCAPKPNDTDAKEDQIQMVLQSLLVRSIMLMCLIQTAYFVVADVVVDHHRDGLFLAPKILAPLSLMLLNL